MASRELATMLTAGRLEALVARGLAAVRAGRLDEAEAVFGEIATAHPKDHRAWHMLAVVALNAARPGVALERARRAVQYDRRNPAYLNTLGIAAAECEQFDEAIGHFRRAVRERASFVDAHYNLGKTLFKIGDLKGAYDACRRAYAFDPRHPGLANSLAWLMRQRGEADGAVALLEPALRSSPDDDTLLRQLGGAYRERSGAAAAIALYRDAIERTPGRSAAHFGLSRLLLARGEWRAGWTEFLWRDLVPRTGSRPEWGALDRDLTGVRLRLLGEQGLGDVLFFVRFAPALKARGASLVLECEPKLVPLLGRSDVFDAVVPTGAAGGEIEQRIFVGDLPALLGAETVPPPLPLAAEPARVTRVRTRLAAEGVPPYIGVTWRAGTDPREPEFGRQIDALFKGLEPEVLAAALEATPGTLVVVQRRPRGEELARLAKARAHGLVDCSALNDDLEEIAALLAALDTYVAVSNTNVHLAASIGAHPRVLVPYPAEWRWMEEGDASPWFPGCVLYRQSPARSWADALAAVSADLRREAAGEVG